MKMKIYHTVTRLPRIGLRIPESWVKFEKVIQHWMVDKAHIAKIKIDQNRKTRLQILDMWCKIVREKYRDSKKNFCTMSFFVNPVASTKTNKIKKRTALFNASFLRRSTLLL